MASAASALVEQAVLHVAKQMEQQVDQEIDRMNGMATNMDEDDIERLRQKRLDQLKKQAEKRQEWLAKGHGSVLEVTLEKEIFELMKGEERVVIHFYKSNLPCKVMDQHLGVLAKSHLETMFVKIDADKAPFLTAKLKVWMLPTLTLIKHEKVVDYVVGLDELGGTYDFETASLEDRLAHAGVIFDSGARAAPQAQQKPTSIKQGGYQKSQSDEDSDFES